VIFAQSPEATPLGIGNWLIDSAAIAALLLIFLKIIDHFKRKPSIDVEFVTKKEFNHHVDSVNHRLEVMNREAIEGRRNLHKDIERVQEKITDKLGEFSIEITNSVGELRGEMRRLGK